MTDHSAASSAEQVPATQPATDQASRKAALRVDELIWADPDEGEDERPRWYWPLFAVMLAALATAIVAWPVVVYQALVP